MEYVEVCQIKGDPAVETTTTTTREGLRNRFIQMDDALVST